MDSDDNEVQFIKNHLEMKKNSGKHRLEVYEERLLLKLEYQSSETKRTSRSQAFVSKRLELEFSHMNRDGEVTVEAREAKGSIRGA